MGFIFQNFNLIPVLSVFENVEYPAPCFNTSTARERKARVEGLLERVGLAETAHGEVTSGLSGGQRQRVAIARAHGDAAPGS